jgi:hypothetical protein
MIKPEKYKNPSAIKKVILVQREVRNYRNNFFLRDGIECIKLYLPEVLRDFVKTSEKQPFFFNHKFAIIFSFRRYLSTASRNTQLKK